MVVITLPGKIAQIIKQGRIELDTGMLLTLLWDALQPARSQASVWKQDYLFYWIDITAWNNKNFHSELGSLT